MFPDDIECACNEKEKHDSTNDSTDECAAGGSAARRLFLITHPVSLDMLRDPKREGNADGV